ncbi:MAG: hypothetical protein JSS94_00555 [Bacteroidetes bacterium]|nr:hypothetical protein [Bacteroidota bacterium]
MKKISVLALFAIAMISCQKETTKVTKVDEKTGKVITVDVPKDSVVAVQENPAIVDSSGIFNQTFKLEKGKTYPFTTYQKQVMTITAPDGKQQSGTNEGTDEVSFTVNDFKNNVYEMTINFISKKAIQSGNGKSLTIDTKQPSPKDEALKQEWAMQKALTENKLQMKMDNKGKIISITGFEPVYAKITKTLSGLTKDQKAIKGMQENMKMSFNEKTLKEQFSKNILVLPTKGAKIGEQWTETENMSADGKVKLKTVYTLSSVGNGVATVTLKGGIPAKTEKQSQGGITHSMSSELSQNGTIVFDQNTGWIKTQNISVKTTQKESMTDGKQQQSMTSSTTSSIKVNP